MSKMIQHILIVLCVVGTGCSNDSPTQSTSDLGTNKPTCQMDGGQRLCATSSFLPANGKVEDFKKESDDQIATNSCELQALIDGGAEKYEKHKFQCMTLAKYASAAKTIKITVWLFDQTDPSAAGAAYEEIGTADNTATAPSIGDASEENLKLPFDYLANMRKGKYLARVFVDKKEGQKEGIQLLQEIATAIP